MYTVVLSNTPCLQNLFFFLSVAIHVKNAESQISEGRIIVRIFHCRNQTFDHSDWIRTCIARSDELDVSDVLGQIS